MFYIGNNKIIKGYIGGTPITHIGMGANDLIDIEGSGIEYPENTVAAYTVSGTSAVSPYSVSGKASDWLETCKNNGDGTSTMIITASTPPTAISFRDVTKLLSVDIIDTNNMISMDYMFCGCANLTSVNCADWNTSSVTSMNGMFSDCSSLTELNVSNWDTSNVTSMSNYQESTNQSNTTTFGMFKNCSSLIELDLSKWNTSKVTSMNFLFYGCSSLTRLNLSNWDMKALDYHFVGSTGNFRTYYYYYSYYMLSGCNSLIELRLDNCNKSTLEKISIDSLTNNPMSGYYCYYYYRAYLPTGTVNGANRNVYLKKSNWSSTTFKTGWTINYVEE